MGNVRKIPVEVVKEEATKKVEKHEENIKYKETMTHDEFKNITVHELFDKFRDFSLANSGLSRRSSFGDLLGSNKIQDSITEKEGIGYNKPSLKLFEVGEIRYLNNVKYDINHGNYGDDGKAYLPKTSPELPLYNKLEELINALQKKDYGKTAELAGIKLVDKKESVDKAAGSTIEKTKKWTVKDAVKKRVDAVEARRSLNRQPIR
jgi:hypothetical protein